MTRYFALALRAFFAGAVIVALSATPARAALLSLLIDNNESILVGDKLFSDFFYSKVGDMPDPTLVNVLPYVDGNGNFGIQFQGAFLDLPGGGGSDAILKFKVTVTDPDMQIVGVNLGGNPDVIGGPGATGIMSVTETFVPEITNQNINIHDIAPGTTKLVDSIVFGNGFTSINVQKDILAFSGTGVATLSLITQTFTQTGGPIIPEPSTMSMLLIGGGLVGLAWRRRKK